MSRIKLVFRFILALFAFIVLLFPFVIVFTPPDPFTQLRALGVVAAIAVPFAVGFVRQSRSFRRLVTYYLTVNILIVPLTVVIVGLGTFVQPFIDRAMPLEIVERGVTILVAYVLAFCLIYRGGYARLKARFA